MRSTILFLVIASISGGLSQNLTAALASNPQLSGLLGLLSFPSVQLPANLNNITLLAPSNNAIQALSNATLQALAANAALLSQILSYHILQGNYSRIPNASLIPTYLQQNVTVGQRVQAVPGVNTTTFYTGLLANSSTVNNTIPFDGGSIHIINSFLVPPVNVSSTSIALNLTSAVGAMTSVGLIRAVDTTPDLTIFVPNNAAFRQVASAIANTTNATLTTILQYHAIPSVRYSTGFSNGTALPSLVGTELIVTIQNGTVYVNNARVLLANVLTSNGVVHVIDQVLNPYNSNGFTGVTSASSDVFTSGVPTPTSRINTSAASGTSRAAEPSISGPGSSDTAGGNGDLSTGAKAAIGVVVPVVAIAAIVAAVFLTRRHMLKKNKTTSTDYTSVPNASEKPELAGDEGRTVTGENGAAYAKPELSNSKSVRRTEVDAGPVPVRHEVEGEGVSANIKNYSDLTNYERYELEGNSQYSSQNR